jgi:Cu+-exporting ATPase
MVLGLTLGSGTEFRLLSIPRKEESDDMDMKTSHSHGGHDAHAGHHPVTPPATTDLKDPVCGMSVTEQSRHKLEHEGHQYYFCSAGCKAKFAADPAKYAEAARSAEPPETHAAAPAGTIYTCPMHPEIRQDHPGNCPKCGMTLEPLMPEIEEGENKELVDFQRRFWWTLPLTVSVTVLAMFGHRLNWFDMAQSWIELALSLPIVLWAGWPFFVRGWQSILNRSPNMWTLIGLGTGAAFAFSVAATIAPQMFPIFVRLDGPRRRVLRGSGRDHFADASGAGPRAQGKVADIGGHQVVARTRSQDRTAHPERRQ